MVMRSKRPTLANKCEVLSLAITAALAWGCNVAGQSSPFEVLYNFPADGSHGAQPTAYLVQGTDGNFYGTTSGGGSSGYGTVYKITPEGALTTLASFAGYNGEYPDGALTEAGDGNFYGVTPSGSGSSSGILFRVTPSGSLTALVTFAGTNGASPYPAPTLATDGNLYGTTYLGGKYNSGTVYRVTTNGLFTTLLSFGGTNVGAEPIASLALGNDGNLYGTTSASGGTVFRVTTNGALTTLASLFGTNGLSPQAPLTLGADGRFYGTTTAGGAFGGGTAFAVSTNGVITTLFSFKTTTTNGYHPQAALTLGTDGNFYSTTVYGGAGNGTVFLLTTNGSLTTLVKFRGSNGALSYGGVTLGTNGDFYGTAQLGGSGLNGLVYRLRHGVYIQSFGMTTNGFALEVLNVGGSGLVVLESSTDLITWAPIQTNVVAGTEQLLDRAALIEPLQFYRVRQQP